ncbi:hypothetical protein L3Y34_016307 [Caenorhabditis briggsae]|uniref:Uncharacterized protein n=2 Tax=Caenorhabditis briggsae TaxID=6238 RepID=A0AAE9J059_CAEBR|nr:hypothetical protein L3Y34_016307 [Caenorhabditis briggsae]
MASAVQPYFFNKNAEYMRMDTVGTVEERSGNNISKYCCIFLTMSVCLGIYGFFNFQNEYTIYVNGKIVNFTGVEDFIPPFVSYDPHILVAPENKLISCAIAKSMSQLTASIMCLLYDEDTFLAQNLSLNDAWNTSRECLEEYAFQHPSPQLLNDPDTVRFAFIRDPIQRFVSFYLDKCGHLGQCLGCNSTDLRCFVRKTYEMLKNISDHRHGFDWDGNVTAEHAAPLSWMCNFDKDLEKWHLLMMGSDLEERKSSILHLGNILKRQGFNETLVEKIQKDMTIGETPHGTHKSSHRQEAERQIREDPYIRDLLHKIYFFDYVVFPFKRDVLDEKYKTNFWKTPEV